MGLDPVLDESPRLSLAEDVEAGGIAPLDQTDVKEEGEKGSGRRCSRPRPCRTRRSAWGKMTKEKKSLSPLVSVPSAPVPPNPESTPSRSLTAGPAGRAG